MAPPDRWEQYSNMGRRIPGTRFICFKVPLRGNEDFNLRVLTDYCSQLGLVVDLTNTKKYYDPAPLESQHIEYKKIFTEGHVVPKKPVVKLFMDTVNEFVEKNAENDKLIGVHCTHGVNRTGYLVCRYMIQLLDVPPDQAIADFDSARGHSQERQLYLNDLRRAMWIDEDPALYSGKKGNKKLSKRAKQELIAYHTPSKPYQDDNDTIHNDEEDDNDTTCATTDNDDSLVDESITETSGPSSVMQGQRLVHRTRAINVQFADDHQDNRGVKRRSRSSSGVRGPWTAHSSDSFGVDCDQPPRPKFKRAAHDSRYADASQGRYDPYYYQQRDGGGPARRDRQEYNTIITQDSGRLGRDREVKKYKGPNKRYRSPSANRNNKRRSGDDSLTGDDRGLVCLADHEPLQFPEDQTPSGGFLENTPVTPKDRSNGGTSRGIFSPDDSTPTNSKSRRRSKMRFEPY